MAGRRLIPAVYKIRGENLLAKSREPLPEFVAMHYVASIPSVTIGFPLTVTVAPVRDDPIEKSDLFFPPGISSLFPAATNTFPAATMAGHELFQHIAQGYSRVRMNG